MAKEVGKTKDVGWQFGLRKTFPIPFERMWDLMFSDKGISIWLGKMEGSLEEKQPFHTVEGIEGMVRVFKPQSHIRMNWKKKNWPNMSTVQVRVLRNGEKSTVSFHQEKLLDANQRLEVKNHWENRMLAIMVELIGK